MEDTLKKILAELEIIRKIKMIELTEKGYSQSKMGNVLGISQASVSRLMAAKPRTNKSVDSTDSNEKT